MNIIINTEYLKSIIKKYSFIIENITDSMILNSLYLVIHDQESFITGSNLYLTAKTILDKNMFKIVSEGVLLIDFALFSAIINKTNEKDITLRVDEGTILTIEGKKLDCKINTLDPKAYPSYDFSLSTDKVQIPRNIIEFAVKKLSKIAKKQESVYVNKMLESILFDSEENNIVKITASNGVQLVSKHFLVKIKPLKLLFNIDSLRTINEITQAKNIDMYIKPQQKIIFTFDDTILICRVNEGDYPNITRITSFVDKCPYAISVKKNEILNAIERANIFTTPGKESQYTQFTIENDKMLISTNNTVKGSSVEEIDLIKSNFKTKIIFKLDNTNILNLISNIDNENILIKFIDTNSPIFILNEADSNYISTITGIKY